MSYRMEKTPKNILQNGTKASTELPTEWNLKPFKAREILTFIVSDFGKPKRWVDIYNFCEKNNICSKRTLSTYLNGLQNRNLIKRVKIEGKKRPRYALVDYENLKALEKRTHDEIAASYEVDKLNRVIRDIEKGQLCEDDVKGQLLYWVTKLEMTLLQFFGEAYRNYSDNPIAAWVMVATLHKTYVSEAQKLLRDFLGVCLEKYPDLTLKALTFLTNRKRTFCMNVFASTIVGWEKALQLDEKVRKIEEAWNTSGH